MNGFWVKTVYEHNRKPHYEKFHKEDIAQTAVDICNRYGIDIVSCEIMDNPVEYTKCRRCESECKLGEALQNTPGAGSPDLSGQVDDPGGTISLTGKPNQVDCWKCTKCGHSFTGGKVYVRN